MRLWTFLSPKFTPPWKKLHYQSPSQPKTPKNFCRHTSDNQLKTGLTTGGNGDADHMQRISSRNIPTQLTVMTALYADNIALISSSKVIGCSVGHMRHHIPVHERWYEIPQVIYYSKKIKNFPQN